MPFKLIIIFSLSLIVGCVVNQPKPEQVMADVEKGSAIYIYRPNSFSNVVVSPIVVIDGKEQFSISNDKYAFVYVSPGKHIIKLKLDEHYQGDYEYLLDAKSNQTYFLRVDTSMKFVQGQPYIRSFNLSEVTKEAGLRDIQDCKYIKSEMPSKYRFKAGKSSENSRFTTDKTSDPFSRNKPEN